MGGGLSIRFLTALQRRHVPGERNVDFIGKCVRAHFLIRMNCLRALHRGHVPGEREVDFVASVYAVPAGNMPVEREGDIKRFPFPNGDMAPERVVDLVTSVFPLPPGKCL